MNTSRLLAIAEFLYGADARQRVFEPMLADCAAELGPAPSLGSRLRWRLAIAVALLRFAPRGFAHNVPFPRIVDIGVRTAAIAAFAFGMQWLVGSMPGVDRATQAWPPSFATTLPFIIIPLVAGIRRLPLPRHQRRLLAILVAVALSPVFAIAIGGNWMVGAAAIAAVQFLVLAGWRIVDPKHFRDQGPWIVLVKPMMIGAAFYLAIWPIKLAMGLPFMAPFWPGRLNVLYLIGAAIYFISARQPDTLPADR